MVEDPGVATGNLIKLARTRRGLSVAKAARDAGIDRTTWQRIEDGLRVQDAKLRRAIDFLGINAHIPLAGNVSGPDEDEGVLLSLPPDALEGLTPAQREEALAEAKAAYLRTIRDIRRRLDS